MDKEFFKKIQTDRMKYSKYAKEMERFFHGKNVMKIQEKIEKQKEVSKSKKMAESFGLNYEKFKKITEKYLNLPQITEIRERDNNFYNLFIKKLDPKSPRRRENEKKKRAPSHKAFNNGIEEDLLCPGKYNPKYSLVHEKVPTVNIKADRNNFSEVKHKKDLIESDLKSTMLQKIQKKEIGIIKNLKLKKAKKNGTIQSTLSHSNSDSKFNTLNNSHDSSENNKIKAVDFKKYLDRKNDFIISNQSKVLSYLEPNTFKKKNKFPKFNKMHIRDVAQSVNNPSIMYYNPKYTLTDKPIKGPLPFKKQENFKNRSLIIHKLWRSFDVFSDYKTMRLKSFINEQLESK